MTTTPDIGNPLGLAEQVRELALVEPVGLVLEGYVEPRSTVLAAVEQDLAVGILR